MIRHVVFFKLRNRDADNVKKVVEVLKSLGKKIDLVKSLEVGIDIMKLDRSYDIVFISSFLNREDLQKYQDHEAHIPVKKYMGEVSQSIISVDYETE
jgi:hypothetical protein